MRGKLPFYDEDPGVDYARINAALLEEYPSENRDELLLELGRAMEELCAFLSAIPVDAWARDFDVRHGDEVLTIESTVEDMIDDIAVHTKQLEAWPRP